MAKSNLTTQEMGLLKAILSHPEAVAEWLDEMQYTACAGLIRYPQLVGECTAHIFAGPEPLYGEVYRAVNCGQNELYGIYSEVSRRQGSMSSVEPIAGLASHPVSFLGAKATITRLKKFVAWQYRQEKARRQAA